MHYILWYQFQSFPGNHQFFIGGNYKNLYPGITGGDFSFFTYKLLIFASSILIPINSKTGTGITANREIFTNTGSKNYAVNTAHGGTQHQYIFHVIGKDIKR